MNCYFLNQCFKSLILLFILKIMKITSSVYSNKSWNFIFSCKGIICIFLSLLDNTVQGVYAGLESHCTFHREQNTEYNPRKSQKKCLRISGLLVRYFSTSERENLKIYISFKCTSLITSHLFFVFKCFFFCNWERKVKIFRYLKVYIIDNKSFIFVINVFYGKANSFCMFPLFVYLGTYISPWLMLSVLGPMLNNSSLKPTLRQEKSST